MPPHLRSDAVWRLARRASLGFKPSATNSHRVYGSKHLEDAGLLSAALGRGGLLRSRKEEAVVEGVFCSLRGAALRNCFSSGPCRSSKMDEVSLKGSGKRVVSLLPAAAEMLAFMGGEHLLVGRGHEDDFPPSITDRPIVTAARHTFTTSAEVDQNVTNSLALGEGLYSLDEEKLVELHPHVIVTQALCEVCAIDYGLVYRIAKRMDPPPEVLSLTPGSLDDIINDVEKIGQAVGMEKEGVEAAESLRRRVAAASSHVRQQSPPPRVAFMEWTDPIFCGGHWTPQLIEMAGGVHPLNPSKGPGLGACESFRITPEEFSAVDPDWIIVCPCGLNMETSLRELADVAQQEWWRSLRAVKEGRVAIIDGNQMFNRSGPRIVDAFEWLVGLLNDDWSLMPANFPWKLWSLDIAKTPLPPEEEDETPAIIELPVEANGQCNAEWKEPDMPVDIEEVHRAACSKGERSYRDPHTGFVAFTEVGLRLRGTCCGNRCRHCPFGHFNVEARKGPKVNTIKEPTLIVTEAVRRAINKRHTEGAPLHAIYWTGQLSDLDALKARQDIILVTAFDSTNGKAIALLEEKTLSNGGVEGKAKGGVSVRVIMDHTRNLRKALFLVPSTGGVDAKSAKVEVVEQLRKHVSWKIHGIAWHIDGDEDELPQN